MAISMDFPMFDSNDKLSKSADALESALAQFSKNMSSGNESGATDIFIPSVNSGNGFDEWLAADLGFGSLSSDESSVSSSSPFSSLEDSPLLGFESFGSAVGPSLFDLQQMCQPQPLPMSNSSKAQVPVLTSSAVQQAAAALNIPWSAELESAVMAQAALGSASVVAPACAQSASSPILAPKEEPKDAEIGSVSLPPVALKVKSSKKRQLTPEEEAEEIVAKRAKNTDAARRSRMKKLIKLEGLELKVSDLESANSALNMKIAILETEKNGFIAKDAEQTARIAQLEAQLAEAHAALTSRAQ